MSLDITQIALHQMIKRDEQTLELVLRDSLLPSNVPVTEMMEELHRVYSAKSKAYGLFNEESELAEALRNCRKGENDFLAFSRAASARLRDEFDVDHCFPYAAWPCGDAWNLMPSARRINIQKSNRLVTQAGLEQASDRITDWWADAFLSLGEERDRQFFLEASQTLPVLASNPGTADIIDAMKLHRIRLSQDQGLRPWEPLKLGERIPAL